MTITNHWGMWVNSENPVTGVMSNNNIEWLSDECNDGINLDYENWLKEIESQESDDEEDDVTYFEDEYESSGSDTILIGEWLTDEQGKYYPNPEGEFAAIVNESETQVVFSKFTKRGNLCSPCFPGQVDLDSEGEFLGYTLPADLIGNLN